MTCPDLGTLRAWLDDAVDDAESMKSHLESCPTCAAAIAELRSNQRTVESAFTHLEPAGTARQSTAEALAAIRARRGAELVQEENTRPLPEEPSLLLVRPHRGFRRIRAALSALAAVIALSFFTLTPPGQSAAAQFLAQFRGQKLAVITFDSAQPKSQFPELQALGTIRDDSNIRTETVSSLAEASQRAGIPVRQIEPSSLPSSVNAKPDITVMPAREVRYVFQSARANPYFASIGHPERTLPSKLENTTLVIAVPAAVVTRYSPARDQDVGLVFAQTGELAIGVEGSASLDEVREFILTLPNLSEATARQLRSVPDWRNTLPIPIPVDQVTWKDVNIQGAPGFIFSDPTGLGSAVIWNQAGRTFGLAGSVGSAELQRAASGIR